MPEKPHSFYAEVEGDFPEYSYPTSPALTLKRGAQVMFVKNDPSPEKLYFNGKIGRITRIGDRSVFVKCPGDHGEITVEPAIWENIQYRIELTTREITEEKAGRFVQLPLKLAWAITIHNLKPDKERKSRTAEYAVSEVGHPELFQALKDWLAARAGEAGVPHYQILHQRVLIQIAAALPDNPAALMRIKGIGKRLFEKYGKELLALVSSYRNSCSPTKSSKPSTGN